MNSIEQNIFNLTSLWKLAGEKSGTYASYGSVNLSFLNPGQWPNKLWIEGKLTPEKLHTAKMLGMGKNLRLALWQEDHIKSDWNSVKYGFEMDSKLTGMSLEGSKIPDFNSEIQLTQISTFEGATEWSDLFFASFGYQLIPSTLLHLRNEVEFFLAKKEEEVFGTGMVYIDSAGVAGIYSLGILPWYRGRNLAGPLLKALLHSIQKKKVNKIILQSSDMGLGLYLKHGFNIDFPIHFYKLTQQ